MSTTSSEPSGSEELDQDNPYVGPRAIRTGEAFFGREREQRELSNLLVAERIVLLHAPSGAGKTSLIQAGIIPILEKRRFRPTIPARVSTPPPTDFEVRNRYTFSVALDLLGATRPREELADLTVGDVVAKLRPADGDGFLVLILDQFEEILSLDPTDWTNQGAFFRQLGECLVDTRVWALISMREDYIGGLDRFSRYMPGHLQTTYRLDFLDRDGATLAIQRPARGRGVDFTDEAASRLVGKLATIRVHGLGRDTTEIPAPYVQPFQLQVVCRRIWRAIARDRVDDFDSITPDDVEKYGKVPRALASYYASAVKEVAHETGANELAIRRWFEEKLIQDGFRMQTLSWPESGDADPASVLRRLQDTYLIRSHTRGDSTWYELAHDMLISAVLDDNRKWLRGRLEPWRLSARAWAEDRERARLLNGLELRAAQRAAESVELTDDERRFLAESENFERDRGAIARMRSVMGTLGVVVALQWVLIAVLLVVIFTR